MNWIKRLYYACKVRFGTLQVKELEQLCAIYIEFQNPLEKASWISLYGWKKVTRRDSKYLLEKYLQYHTADEGLLKADWLLKNEHIRHAYLHGLCLRPIPLTAAEEDWILNCGEAGAMRCLTYPLSEASELKLLRNGDFKMMYNYVICHVLSAAGEAFLAASASDNAYPYRAAEYRKILKRYFELRKDFYHDKLFTSFEAQWALFADERNKEFIFEVIEQCNMDDFVLENAIIRRMAWGMSPEYLMWYLSYSYVADKDLIAELLEKGLSEHLRDMIAVSEQRRAIHEIVKNSLLFFSDDWRDDEREAYCKFDREDDAKKRHSDLEEFLRPRFKKGLISPAMSAWVAARCPELAKEVQLNLTRFEERVLSRMAFINPLDFHHCNANVY